MADGKIDGHFILTSDISTGIRNELGITVDDCKRMGSVWDNILKEANNTANFVENENNKNSIPNQKVGTLIKFSKECWQKIVNMVNKALETSIKSETPNELEDNINIGKNSLNTFNEQYPNLKSGTFNEDLFSFLKEYAKDETKLKELKSLAKENTSISQLVEYLENYSNKQDIKSFKHNAKQLTKDKAKGDANIKDCLDRAQIIQKNLQSKGINCRIGGLGHRNFKRPEHAFAVIGLPDNADMSNPSTWGENAVIIDAWAGKVFKYADGIEYYSQFLRYDNNNKDQMIFFEQY